MAVAMEWVGRIMAAAAMMVVPGLGGQWVGHKISANWLALVGFAIGLTGAIYYLIATTKPATDTSESSVRCSPLSKKDPPQ